MIDKETTAILAAYQALRGFSRSEWSRALEYIGARLAGDDRTGFIMAGEGWPQPLQWVVAGDLDTAGPCAEDAVLDGIRAYWTPIEVNGIAVVSQRFAVVLPCGVDEGERVQWFDTHTAAMSFITDSLTLAKASGAGQ